MIYFTGDIHASHHIGKLSAESFPAQKEMTRADFVVICGDFGCVWDGGEHDRFWQDWLESKPFTTLFVDGNHENYDLLKEYPVETWHGGCVQFIRPHVIHLMRGQIFDIDGKTVFTMGGAACHDLWNGVLDEAEPHFTAKLEYMQKRNMFFRVNHQSWWKEELPSGEELAEGLENLENCAFTVDYVVTHCLADRFHLSFTEGGYTSDGLTQYFTALDEKITCRHWFCGHYHTNAMLDERHTVLFEAVINEVDWAAASPDQRKSMLEMSG